MKRIELNYTGSATHYPALDGLRGIAVLSVIFFHVVYFRHGWMGVDLFFVLSGFLITSILIDTRNGQHYFKNFYFKRVLRIFPLYYGVLILFFLPIFIRYGINGSPNSLPYFFYFQNIVFTITNKWPTDILLSINHFWSLAIEEQFYLFFPFIVYFVRPRLYPFVFLLGILLSIACRMYLYINDMEIGGYVFLFSRTDSLLMGALAAWYVRTYKSIRIDLSLIVLAAFLTVAFMASDFIDPVYRTFGLTVNAIFFTTVLLFALSPISGSRAFFENRVLQHFGKYSYGLYVFHYIYFNFIEFYVDKHFSSPKYSKLLVIAATLSLTYVTALISYNVFEKRFLKLKKYLIN